MVPTDASVPDQRAMWDRLHAEQESTADPEPRHRAFLEHFVAEVTASGRRGPLLELGCGHGLDSLYLAAKGFRVEALDFSAAAIGRARAAANATAGEAGGTVNFVERDITLPLPYPDAYFAGVFAYLSLHYFSPDVTCRVIGEIARTAMDDAPFAFCVRSVRDPLHGEGELIAGNLYLRAGHIRRFFTEKELAELLSPGWTILSIETHLAHYLRSVRMGGICYVVARRDAR